MLKLNIPNLEAIRNWCNEKFQPKGNYITKSEISNEVNETEITLSDLSETVPEAISAMSEEKKLKNLLSHIKAFMTGSKALIDLCVTTGMITQQNINDENKVPSAALLYSLNDALNGQVAQINSNLILKKYTTPTIFLDKLTWKDSYGGKKYTDSGIYESDIGGTIVSTCIESWGNWKPNLNVFLNTRNGVVEIVCNDISLLNAYGASAIMQITVWYYKQ